MSDFDASSLSSYVSTSEANTTASDGDCWKAGGDMCAECGRAWKLDCPLCQVCRDSGAGAFLDVPIVGWFGEGLATNVAEELRHVDRIVGNALGCATSGMMYSDGYAVGNNPGQICEAQFDEWAKRIDEEARELQLGFF